jgi:hypothetical protein
VAPATDAPMLAHNNQLLSFRVGLVASQTATPVIKAQIKLKRKNAVQFIVHLPFFLPAQPQLWLPAWL